MVLLLLSPGCFEAETTITLRADGSGTQRLRLLLGDEAVGTLRRAVDVSEASASRVDPLDVFDADKVRAELHDSGVRLTEHRVSEDGHRRCVELSVAFASLDSLGQNPLTGGARAAWEFTSGPRPGQVRLVYYPQGVEAWKAARVKARELAQQPDEVVQHFVAGRLRVVEDLDVALSLELPGDIVAHTANLELASPRKVTVRTRAADIRSATDLLVRLAPRFEVVFTCPEFPLPDARRAAVKPPAPEASATKGG